jgi:hypothetical protein
MAARQAGLDRAPAAAHQGQLNVGRPKGSRNKRFAYHSIFDAKPDFDAARRMRQGREYERKALRASLRREAALPPPPREAAPAPVESAPVYTYVIIGHGDGGANPGQIRDGHYTVAGNIIRVRNAEGQLLGTQALRPGENAATVAKQILRGGAPSDFYRPLPARVYPY